MLNKPWPLWGFLPLVILFVFAFFGLTLMKAPLFSSGDLEGARKKAIETKNPSKCNKLATSFGGLDLRGTCYSQAIYAIKDVALCDKYPVSHCRQNLARILGDASLCGPITDPNRFNSCIYSAAEGGKNPSICNLLKGGTNYSKDQCLIWIIQQNIRNIPTTLSVQDAKGICVQIQNRTLKDHCVVSIIMGSKDPSLCALVNDLSNFNGVFAEDGRLAIKVCRP